MVGKLSDDRLMSGSRIPVLYMWKYGSGHPWSTPNDELRKSIAAKNGEPMEVRDIGEPGICGNLLEATLVLNVCEELDLPDPLLTPPVIDKSEQYYQVSLDGLTTCPQPRVIFASDVVEIVGGGNYINVRGPIPIETKVTSAHFDDDILLYRGPIQLQMQMMAVNAEYGILMTLYQGIQRRITIYPRDREIQQRIRELCIDFADRVRTETYYPPVSVDDCAKTYPTTDFQDRVLDDVSGDVERIVQLRTQLKEVENEIESLQTKVMSAMQEAETARAGRFLVKWPVRRYKGQPEKIVPATEERVIRLKTLQIKEI